MMRRRFIGLEANISSPRKTAFPISAPAMPWVIVSIVRVYPMRLGGDILADEQEWLCLGDDLADELRRDAVALESRNGGAGGFGRDRNQKPTRSLRLAKQLAMFLRNSTCESHASPKE